ncbi:Tyrosinase [Zancudomyces culisetae]|uniref:Tyrosinase n=1 Tax=Zancudomyces culisetae TaxID=1213189 RepID=A0A1R1PS93_ZANCU|nr:Tyrosinase [Zancudomyces culisetae]|eukprot:OMH83763.1 Tyrosinase [Zancudomyces culisetae]
MNSYIYKVLFFVVSLIATQGQNTPPRCQRNFVRRDVRSLSSAEWNRMVSTISSMNQNGWFAWFSRIHTINANAIHNWAQFLPFHRRFIIEFENVARRYQSDFAIPYWDSARDFDNPAGSVVMSGSYLGGNGGPGRCVRNGIQANMIMSYPTRHCLQRAFNGGSGINPWQSPELVSSLIQTSVDYNSFRTGLEYGIHASVHNGIGGDMATMNSPNDFAFFLHHSNIDRIWWGWQNARQNNLMGYGGRNIDGSAASLNDNISVYGDRVGSLLRLGNGRVCYSYSGQSTLAKRQNSQGNGDSADSGLLRYLSSDYVKQYFPLLPSKNIDRSAIGLPVYGRPVSTAGMGRNGTIANGASASSGRGQSVNQNGSKQMNRPNNGRGRRIRYPALVSEKWLRMNNYDVNYYRRFYSRERSIVDMLNRSGYVSPYL